MYKERLYLIALDIFVYLEYLQLRIIWDRIEHDTQVRVVQSPVNVPSDRPADLECWAAAAIKYFAETYQ